MPFDREVQLVRADDGAVRWVGAAGRAQRDEKGQVVAVHGAIQDITDRIEAQLEGSTTPATSCAPSNVRPATSPHSSTRPWSRSGTPFAPLGIEAEGSAYPHDHGLTIYFRDVSRHRSLGPPSNDGE